MKTNKFILAALSTLTLISCSDKGEDGANSGGSASSNVDIVFSSSDITSFSQNNLKLMSGSNCNVTTDSGNESGLCYTPLEVKGTFNAMTLGSTSGGAPVRLLGGGSLSGVEAVFHHAEFDLKESPAIEGEDNIQDGGGTYNMSSLSVQHIEFAVSGTASNKIYRVRVPFVATVPSQNSEFIGCIDSGGLSEADTYGDLFSGIFAEAGDILVCIKNSISDACTDSDYLWIDNSGNTSVTRPTTPKRLTGAYMHTPDSCTEGSDHPEVTWGYAGLDIMLSSSVAVSAVIDSGIKTYTVGSESGSKLTLNMDIDVAGSVFVPNSASVGDLSNATESVILQNIDKIQLKPVYIKNNKQDASPGIGDMTASVSLEVSDE